MVAERIETKRLVFVDEMGTSTSLSPLYARSLRGQRARSSVPRNRGANTTLLASMSAEGMGPCMAVVASTTAMVFEAYVEQALCPSLKRGQVVVMDNLSAHKGQRIRELIEARGCELVYLPPYSPDFNPIEEAFSKIKGILGRIEARTREVLVGALGEAIPAVTARDARGFFEHCGYSVGIARWVNHRDERCQYGTVYDQIEDGDWPELSVDDFQIVNPMDEVVSVNPYSEDVDQDLFRMPSGGTGAAVVTT